tara:strand:+ start:3472 stop:5007 length:1536 start_codon:yes stop_codon:yes gene_type:complete
MIKKALISVWDKNGVLELAQFLVDNNIEIISTGGTAKYLKDNNIDITPVSDITGLEAVMDGRVKTLNPKIFGGILADRTNNSHIRDLNSMSAPEIDLVVVNLYPFVKEAVKNNLPMNKAIEYIDIGGPSMLRAAAKNYHSVCVLSDASDYSLFMSDFNTDNNEVSLELRHDFALKVFQLTSSYDLEISQYFNKNQDNTGLPENRILHLNKVQDLRYGENPHQLGAFYLESDKKLDWVKHQGKNLSYNNYLDLQSAYDIVNEFQDTACAIVKHSNPCGFATGESNLEAYNRAVSCDPVSYFGGIVSFNKEVSDDVAQELVEPFLECIVAPSFSEGALQILSKKKNLRVLSMPSNNQKERFEIKSASGGYLFQEKDSFHKHISDCDVVTNVSPNQNQLKALELGWKIVRYVKSNAIVIANSHQVLGIGAGQMSRIDSLKIAIRKIKEFNLSLDEAIIASDAFFPFPDSLELAADNKIISVIQPGGSIKDKEIVEKANQLGISMVFTSERHFYH